MPTWHRSTTDLPPICYLDSSIFYLRRSGDIAMDSLQRIPCDWCGTQSPAEAVSCVACGAPLDVRKAVSLAGWRSAPRIKDMTELHFSHSTVQVEGEIVPVAEITLGDGDAVYFEGGVLAWKEDSVLLTVMQVQSTVQRTLFNLPYVISVAYGVGRAAFAREHSGELVALPMHPNTELDVREHALLVASYEIGFTFVRIQGLRNILFGGQGMYMDRLITREGPGLLLLHGYGNVFERILQPGECILIEPGAFLYKDAAVTMNVELQQLSSGVFGGTNFNLVRMTGPGRVGIQSMYVHHETG
jgi:uncharacterized protein (AIM24 family)